jgi:hypothetical protein
MHHQDRVRVVAVEPGKRRELLRVPLPELVQIRRVHENHKLVINLHRLAKGLAVLRRNPQRRIDPVRHVKSRVTRLLQHQLPKPCQSDRHRVLFVHQRVVVVRAQRVAVHRHPARHPERGTDQGLRRQGPLIHQCQHQISLEMTGMHPHHITAVRVHTSGVHHMSPPLTHRTLLAMERRDRHLMT